MSAELSGVTALITGGTSGIGRATAVALARLGAHVAVTGRDKQRGDEVVHEITEAGGRADFLAAELSDEHAAQDLADRAVAALGRVDVLVNNAGVSPFGPTEQTSEADFDRVYRVNVQVPYFLVARLAPAMAERGHGAIVNVSTMVAEFGPRGVRVNAVSPGPTRTPGTAGMGESLDQLAAGGPAGRPGSPEEIAEAIVYLATDRSSFVHGAILPVDGGRVAV